MPKCIGKNKDSSACQSYSQSGFLTCPKHRDQDVVDVNDVGEAIALNTPTDEEVSFFCKYTRAILKASKMGVDVNGRKYPIEPSITMYFPPGTRISKTRDPETIELADAHKDIFRV